ncbi:hypothetical protein FJT64_013202 [Amphibalanus amphitrite]|uniref:Uncharacterized protein n=1 Tax=Amphibalanus amphitrite TaxID=1232801 RepID=A0A6A4VDG5_AMPAM|nr:hypothetical protein FJT64_013202 [Amphibalanus amphitrite]
MKVTGPLLVAALLAVSAAAPSPQLHLRQPKPRLSLPPEPRHDSTPEARLDLAPKPRLNRASRPRLEPRAEPRHGWGTYFPVAQYELAPPRLAELPSPRPVRRYRAGSVHDRHAAAGGPHGVVSAILDESFRPPSSILFSGENWQSSAAGTADTLFRTRADVATGGETEEAGVSSQASGAVVDEDSETAEVSQTSSTNTLDTSEAADHSTPDADDDSTSAVLYEIFDVEQTPAADVGVAVEAQDTETAEVADTETDVKVSLTSSAAGSVLGDGDTSSAEASDSISSGSDAADEGETASSSEAEVSPAADETTESEQSEASESNESESETLSDSADDSSSSPSDTSPPVLTPRPPVIPFPPPYHRPVTGFSFPVPSYGIRKTFYREKSDGYRTVETHRLHQNYLKVVGADHGSSQRQQLIREPTWSSLTGSGRFVPRFYTRSYVGAAPPPAGYQS